MKQILFVCTGNIFRSLIAEYAVRAALGADPQVRVASAGTSARPQAMREAMVRRLRERGLEVGGHRQRRVTDEILAAADLVIAMGTDHRDFLREHHGCRAVLFQELAAGEAVGLLDVEEALTDWQENPEAVAGYVEGMVDRICDAAPRLCVELHRRLGLSL